jgi:hypothetical protein
MVGGAHTGALNKETLMLWGSSTQVADHGRVLIIPIMMYLVKLWLLSKRVLKIIESKAPLNTPVAFLEE